RREEKKNAAPVLEERVERELSQAGCRIADDDALSADLIYNDEMIPFSFLPVRDGRQWDLLQRARRAAHGSREKSDLLGCRAEAREVRAFLVRACEFAQSCDGHALLVVSRNHREDGGSAVCHIVLVNDRVSHIAAS